MAFKGGKIQSTLQSGLGVGIGVIGGSFLVKTVPFLAQSPIVGSVAEIVVASILSTGRGAMTKDIAAGMAGHAVLGLVKSVAGPQLANTLGISGIGAPWAALMPGSNLMPGVAGNINGAERIMANPQIMY